MNNLQMNQLSKEQTVQIRELEQVCLTHDGLLGTVFLSNEINFSREVDSFYLLYDGERLVSFLSLFIPTKEQAEISAFTLPECRNSGYFHLLFQKATNELKKHGIFQILFVHEPQSKDASAVLNHFGAGYSFSEYLLAYDRSVSLKCESNLRLERSSPELIPEIADLDTKVFHNQHEESVSMVTKSMESPEIQCYSAFLGDNLIGLCNVNLEGGDISIFGVGISPEYQGKGYGREMLNLLLDTLIHSQNGEITLEVDSENAAAYHLYITSGFRIKTQFDYHTYLLEKE